MHIGTKMKIALIVGAVFLLLGNGFIMYKNYQTEWRAYQEEYLKLVIQKTSDPVAKQVLEERSPRIEQIVTTGFGRERVDRCMTCHAGIDDVRFEDAPLPYRSHPRIPGDHPYRTFGCTTCHDGNGRGLATADAHGEDKYWMEPLLRGDYIESGCAKCHGYNLVETPKLRQGAELFFTKACYGCHKVEGMSDGKLGVELTRVGAKWPLSYLEESIVDPKANNFESMMPKMEVSPDEVKALTIFLKSLTGESLIKGPVERYYALKEWKAAKPAEVEVSVESGKQVFANKHCNACHTINGVGAKIAPDLSVYGLQRTKEWMIQHHINPRSLVGGSVMPDFKYSKTELEALATYLESLKLLYSERSEAK
ncbi:MAG: cytochrome c [Ignavibacteriae bacterium]|nr:cytochrome c [Ignavibacteriota bacterium]